MKIQEMFENKTVLQSSKEKLLEKKESQNLTEELDEKRDRQVMKQFRVSGKQKCRVFIKF